MFTQKRIYKEVFFPDNLIHERISDHKVAHQKKYSDHKVFSTPQKLLIILHEYEASREKITPEMQQALPTKQSEDQVLLVSAHCKFDHIDL